MDKHDFKVNRLSDYSDEALLSELERVASIVPSGPITRSVFNQLSKASASTLMRRFGGWRQSLEKAGLASRYSGQPVTERMRKQPGRSVSKDEVVSELRRVAQELGRNDFTVEDFNAHGRFSASAVRVHFKVWSSALKAAGLSPRSTSFRYSDEECFENLLQVWTLLGRQPKYREMTAPPSQVGGKAYVGRWGTWIRALEAFVERVNADVPIPPSPLLSSEKTRSVEAATAVDDDGRVRLGVRYRVLVRDNFKCMLCGRSPATDPSCRLHVDHIEPYSKGGRTVFENLRTLCEACNLGKGNLTIEINR